MFISLSIFHKTLEVWRLNEGYDIQQALYQDFASGGRWAESSRGIQSQSLSSLSLSFHSVFLLLFISEMYITEGKYTCISVKNRNNNLEETSLIYSLQTRIQVRKIEFIEILGLPRDLF